MLSFLSLIPIFLFSSFPIYILCSYAYSVCTTTVPLLRDLYANYVTNLHSNPNNEIKMGIKCPRDLEVDIALSNYDKFVPNTKFIIGIRHPIKWFESFYNHRITNEFPMPTDTSKLIGKCKQRNYGVCTFRANFTKHLLKIPNWRNVFLYDVNQLNDNDLIRSKQFLLDLSNFLNLSKPLTKPMIWIKPGQSYIDTLSNGNQTKLQEIQSKKINICDDQHIPIRNVLHEQGIRSSNWIQDVFIKNPHVTISSPIYFEEILNKWKLDPCDDSHK